MIPLVSSENSKNFLRKHLRDLPYFRALIRSVEAHYYQVPLEGPVLDVGCGDGHFAQMTFDYPLDVGIDPWSAPLKETTERSGVYKVIVQGDAGKMPFQDGYFGTAISNSVLEHIPHVDQVLKETSRTLRNGALFLFCVPNQRYLNELHVSSLLSKIHLSRLAEKYKEWFRVMSRVCHADPPDIWQERLERAGFNLLRYWNYFSPSSMRALEWGHYFGLPSLLVHSLLGRWLISSALWNLWFTERLIRKYADPEMNSDGVFTFYVAEKI